MKKEFSFILNILLILHIFLYFFLLVIFLRETSSTVLITIFGINNILFSGIFRYVVLLINFSILKKRKEYEHMKIIFYSNIFNLILFIFLIYFRVIYFYVVFNILMFYPEVIITTIFNIPILYIISSKIIKNKFIVILTRILLILMFIYNIYLLIDGEFFKSLNWLP